MHISNVGTVTITEDAVTFSGFGNLTRDHEHIIKAWAIDRLQNYPNTKAQRKQINHAVFPDYAETV